MLLIAITHWYFRTCFFISYTPIYCFPFFHSLQYIPGAWVLFNRFTFLKWYVYPSDWKLILFCYRCWEHGNFSRKLLRNLTVDENVKANLLVGSFFALLFAFLEQVYSVWCLGSILFLLARVLRIIKVSEKSCWRNCDTPLFWLYLFSFRLKSWHDCIFECGRI